MKYFRVSLAYLVSVIIGWLPSMIWDMNPQILWMLGYLGGMFVGFFIFDDRWKS